MSGSGIDEAPFAWAHWLPRAELVQFERASTTAYRLHTAGRREATPDGWVERLGGDLLISHKDDATRDALLAACRAWPAWSGVSVERIFGKHLPRQNADRITPVLLAGDSAL